MQKKEIAISLQEKGMRATKNRIQVLAFVEKQKHPIGIELLKKEFPHINEVTLYRMASDFVKNDFWNAVNLGHGHLDYESKNRPHHHHAVCNSCGFIEEVYGCKKECQLTHPIAKQAKRFQNFKTSNSAIFGICNNCAKM